MNLLEGFKAWNVGDAPYLNFEISLLYEKHNLCHNSKTENVTDKKCICMDYK